MSESLGWAASFPATRIVGKVRITGDDVTGFQVGVGCIVDSCLKCEECRAGLEQYC